MKIIVANSVGRYANGEHIVHFPSRWTASVGMKKCFTYYPYELAYLSSVLKRDTAHQVKLIDGNLLQLNADEYIKLLAEHKPDWLVMEPATMTYKDDLKVALALKKEFNTKVIFAGPHATAFPEQTMADGADCVCIGEYEYTVLDIVNGLDRTCIRGLYPNPRRELLDVNDLPFPEDNDISRWDYINIGGSDYKEIEMFASRGCVRSCVFCVCRHLYYAKPNWRPRNVESVIAEIKYLAGKYPQMEGIFFDEEEHNTDKNFILGLTKAIKANGFARLKYNAMCGYWTLDREMIEAMRSAGYYKLRIGIETASETVARAMNKKIDIPRLKSVLRVAKETGMRMYGTFTIGAPMSTRDEDMKTVRLIRELLDEDLLYDLQISLCTPQPGTPFYDWARSGGYLKKADWRSYDGATSPVISYPGYTDKEIKEVFCLARAVQNNAYETRLVRVDGLPGFLLGRLKKHGFLEFSRRALGKLRKELGLRGRTGKR